MKPYKFASMMCFRNLRKRVDDKAKLWNNSELQEWSKALPYGMVLGLCNNPRKYKE